MMELSSLPQEILDLIIDAVPSSDRIEPLKTLSVVSRRFPVPHFQKVYPRFPQDRVNLFRNLRRKWDCCRCVTTNGCLFSYVRDLIINAGALNSLQARIKHKYLGILRLFTNVNSFWICCWGFQELKSAQILQALGHFGAAVKALELFGCCVNSEVLDVDDIAVVPFLGGA